MNRTCVLLLFLTLGGAVLRLAGLGAEPFWLDEAASLDFASRDLVGTLLAEIEHPPLYRVFLHFWTRIVGQSEFAVRLPSAVLSTLSVPLAFSVARRLFSKRTAWWTAALIAASAYQIHYAQESRNYALLLFATLLAAWTCLRMIESPRPGRIVAFAAAVLLGLFTHYFFVFPLAALFFHVLGFGRRRMGAFVLAAACAGVLFLPWAAQVVKGFGDQERAWMVEPVRMSRYAFFRASAGYGVKVQHQVAAPDAEAGPIENSLPARALPPLLLLIAVTFSIRGIVRDGAGRLVYGMLLLPPAACILVYLLGGPALASDRTFIFATPFLAMAAARGLEAIPRRWSILLGTSLIAVSLMSLIAWHANPRAGKEEWDDVGLWLDEHSAKGDVVLVHKPYLTLALGIYRSGEAAEVPVDEPSDAGADEVLALPAVRDAERVFLVLAHARWDTKEEWVDLLDARLDRVGERLFPKLWGIRVFSWRR